ncbi:MAG: TetR family transcriptional regulator [Burkholderiales bacterium]|nr:TetR family transcriptional regulator [Burkholderiales bacterium]
MTSAKRKASTTPRTTAAKVKATAKAQPGKPRGRPKATVGRPRKDLARPDAADRILDAAEDLFSKRGFDGVTIREVTELANVDTALVHYYFTSKQGLFDAVLGRRAELVFAERMRAFDELDRVGGRITLEEAVRAFIQPLLARAATGDPGWKNYFRLLSVVNNDPNHVAQSVMSYFDPVVHRLIDALSRALPNAKREELFWCFHFLTGSLTLALSRTGRLDRVSGGLCKSEDLAAIEPRMVEYCAAGIRHVCLPTAKVPASALAKPRRTSAVG